MWINGSSKEYFECKSKIAELKEFAEKLHLPKAIDEGMRQLTHKLNWYAEFYEKWHIDTDVHSITYGGGRIESCEFACYCGTIKEISNVHGFKGPMELMNIRFSTGAYVFFGDYYDYLNDHFLKMIDEIVKETKPEYFDSCNHSLYYKPENSGSVFAKVTEIVRDYRKSGEAIVKKAKIEKLKRQLKDARGERGAIMC